jgi:hypothetical protein
MVAGQVQFAGPVGRPHQRAGHRDPPPAQDDRARLAAMPLPGTAGVVLALRPAAAQRPRRTWPPSPAPAGNLTRLPTRLGTTAVLLVGLAHGSPLPSSDELALPDTYHSAGHAGDGHFQVHEGLGILIRPASLRGRCRLGSGRTGSSVSSSTPRAR